MYTKHYDVTGERRGAGDVVAQLVVIPTPEQVPPYPFIVRHVGVRVRFHLRAVSRGHSGHQQELFEVR